MILEVEAPRAGMAIPVVPKPFAEAKEAPQKCVSQVFVRIFL